MAGFLGTDTFDYTVSDGNGGMDTATVTVSVEETPPLVNFRLEALNDSGQSIDAIMVGESFTLRGYVEDIRVSSLGAFSAYLDVLYDSGLVSVNAPITDGGGLYTVARDGSTATPGLLDEVGGILGGVVDESEASPVGSGAFVLFEVSMQANSGGQVHFTGNPSDNLPLHEVTVFGESLPLSDSSITFTGDSLLITNEGPIANDDAFRIQTDSTDNSLAVLTNDTSLPDSSNLTIGSILNGPTSGTASIAADGRSILYTPSTNLQARTA